MHRNQKKFHFNPNSEWSMMLGSLSDQFIIEKNVDDSKNLRAFLGKHLKEAERDVLTAFETALKEYKSDRSLKTKLGGKSDEDDADDIIDRICSNARTNYWDLMMEALVEQFRIEYNDIDDTEQLRAFIGSHLKRAKRDVLVAYENIIKDFNNKEYLRTKLKTAKDGVEEHILKLGGDEYEIIIEKDAITIDDRKINLAVSSRIEFLNNVFDLLDCIFPIMCDADLYEEQYPDSKRIRKSNHLAKKKAQRVLYSILNQKLPFVVNIVQLSESKDSDDVKVKIISRCTTINSIQKSTSYFEICDFGSVALSYSDITNTFSFNKKEFKTKDYIKNYKNGEMYITINVGR